MKPILIFAEFLYLLVTRLRNSLYDHGLLAAYTAELPVISVGNLVAGGAGKTPLTIFLARKLKEQGFKPVVLSRGYGGKIAGPHVVSSGDTAADVGDEPLLISRVAGVPLVVSRVRSSGARLIAEQQLGNVIILDDGFQHRALARDLDIVLVNVTTENLRADFMKGWLLPRGRFREDRNAALKRAGMFVFHASCLHEERAPEVKALLPQEQAIFYSHLAAGRVENAAGEALQEKKVSAFCGIAHPANFFLTLEELGYQLQKKISFPDHHLFSSAELEKLSAEQYPLICTEKDLTRIPRPSRDKFYALKTELIVSNEAEFVSAVVSNIRTEK